MDSNQQSYFLLREADEFATRATQLVWSDQRSALVLAQNQLLRLPASDEASALSLWDSARPLVLDPYFQQCRIAVAGDHLEYNSGRGFLPLVDGDLRVVDTPAGTFRDIAIGGDGRVAAAYSNDSDTHGVLVFHLTARWQAATELPEPALRVWVDQDNKVWCLTASQLICCQGQPLPHSYQPTSTRFEPVSINPDPLHISWQAALPAGVLPLALCGDEQQLCLLAHDGSGNQQLLLRSLQLHRSEWQHYPLDAECPFSIDARFLSSHRLALMAPAEASDTDFENRDCVIVQLRWHEPMNQGQGMLVHERFPMLSQAQSRFASTLDGKVRYQANVDSESEQAEAGFSIYPRELLSLRRPRYLSAAMATLSDPLDAGLPETVWHRIYLEGCIPKGCKLVIYAKAYNTPAQRTSTPFIRQPDWVWCRHRSEQGFGQGLVDAKENESGLFELLLQRNTGPVRRLSGRYLQLRLRFESNGQHTPAVHALKVYYPRFSYQEAYLPEHFRQEYSVDPTLDGQAANGADFRERMLAGFESLLTPLEGRISRSEILLSPEHTPAEHLPWLAELFGQPVPEHWPEKRKRRWIKESGRLQACKGTLAGLQLALDIVTDGAVAQGRVVLVENFRLRRTMATILGLNMDDSDHPLTLGTGVSGNSLVGESLILSDGDSQEFLALFSPEVADSQEAEVVEKFFDQYANQVSVLLHGPAKDQRPQVEAMLESQMPAHIQWRIIESDHPFVLGLSPLLGVDTYLETKPEPRPVILNDTYLGAEGLLRNPVALSPQDVHQ